MHLTCTTTKSEGNVIPGYIIVEHKFNSIGYAEDAVVMAYTEGELHDHFENVA